MISFFYFQGSHRKPWTTQRITDVINDIKKARVTMSCGGQNKTAMDYYWLKKYDIVETGNEESLIFKRLTVSDPTVYILPREQYFDVLMDIHKSCGHGGRDKILYNIKNKYYIPKKAVELFASLCPICETKKNVPKKGIVTKPIVSRDFNLRGQVDLMDFQSCPDGEYKWLLNYQDNATKFINLRPLKTKRAVEVASELMKIFLIFGAPYILQSDNGREFTANIIKELIAIWPECKIVHGSPRHPQTQGSIERSNQDVENMLRAWMSEKKSTNWSVGCFFVQYFKNASFHRIIGRSPYKALFGREPKAGLSGSDIPPSELLNLETEEQLEILTEKGPAETTDSETEKKYSNLDVIQNVENLQPNHTCAVCHNEATGAHKCDSCNSVVHAICGITIGEEGYGSKVVCVMCQVEKDINLEREEAHKGLKRAADKMIDATVKKMPKLDIGNSVLVNVPKVDRGPLDMKKINGKIVDIRNGVHQVGTKYGTIKNWFSRQDLQYSDTNYADEISDKPISLREAVSSQSPFGGQGFQKCTCKPAVNQCRNNRCACFKTKVLCGSKCHGSLTCVNK